MPPRPSYKMLIFEKSGTVSLVLVDPQDSNSKRTWAGDRHGRAACGTEELKTSAHRGAIWMDEMLEARAAFHGLWFLLTGCIRSFFQPKQNSQDLDGFESQVDKETICG